MGMTKAGDLRPGMILSQPLKDLAGRTLLKEGAELTEEQFDYVVMRYKEYARRAGDGGYRVGPETHWGPSLTADVQRKVHDAVDSPAYGVLLHVGHWHGGQAEATAGDAMPLDDEHRQLISRLAGT